MAEINQERYQRLTELGTPTRLIRDDLHAIQMEDAEFDAMHARLFRLQ